MSSERTLPAGWAPRIYLWDGGWLGIGRGQGIVPPHAHHAIQVTLSLEHEVGLREPDGEWRSYRGAMVRADAPHSLDPRHAMAALLFLDADAREGRLLRGLLRAPIVAIPEERLERPLAAMARLANEPPEAREAAVLLGQAVRALAGGSSPARPPEERILRALEVIRARGAERVPLEAIAKAVHLSPSRFAHLFREEVGLPFRRYVLWRRLTRAMIEFGRGRNLTAAAHASGFTDSSHLTRTFHQMFGLAPTAMLGGGEFHEVPAPLSTAP